MGEVKTDGCVDYESNFSNVFMHFTLLLLFFTWLRRHAYEKQRWKSGNIFSRKNISVYSGDHLMRWYLQSYTSNSNAAYLSNNIVH